MGILQHTLRYVGNNVFITIVDSQSNMFAFTTPMCTFYKWVLNHHLYLHNQRYETTWFIVHCCIGIQCIVPSFPGRAPVVL